MKTAVIGIGSNSVRMLVATIDGHTGLRLRRDRAGTRLFAGLDENNRLNEDAMLYTLQAVHRMASSAREEGVSEIHLFATSATRDAQNGAEFAAMLRESTGLHLEICSGNEEAALSFLGATGRGYCGVIDIGGGSTEVVCGEGENLACAFSCQMGAVRLSRRMPIRCFQDLQPVIRLSRDILHAQLERLPDFRLPAVWYGTGGTFTTLGAMVLQVSWTDRTHLHGTLLPLSRVHEIAQMLADMTVEERKLIPGIQAHRADIIVHGICILIACMEEMQLDAIRVSEFGNLDGYLQKTYALKTLL